MRGCMPGHLVVSRSSASLGSLSLLARRSGQAWHEPGDPMKLASNTVLDHSSIIGTYSNPPPWNPIATSLERPQQVRGTGQALTRPTGATGSLPLAQKRLDARSRRSEPENGLCAAVCLCKALPQAGNISDSVRSPRKGVID